MRKFQPILQSFEHFLLLSIFFRHIYAFTIQLHGSKTTSFHFIFRLAPFFCTPQTPICVKHSVLFSCHGSSTGKKGHFCFFFNTSSQWPFTIDREIVPRNGHLLSLLIQFIQWLHRHHLARTHTGSIDFNTWIYWLDFLFHCKCSSSISSENGWEKIFQWLLNQSQHRI